MWFDCDFFCLYLWIYWLYCLFRGAVLRSKGRKIIYGLYDMALWEKLSAVHYWLIKVRSMTLIIPCEMGSCVDECFEIFCPLLSHIISWTCSSTVLVPIQLPFLCGGYELPAQSFFFFEKLLLNLIHSMLSISFNPRQKTPRFFWLILSKASIIP